MDPLYIILIISVIGPILGSLIGVLKKPSELFTFNMLSFAAGVMLAISFLELIPKSIEHSTVWLSAIGLLIGTIFMYGVDKLIPHIHPETFELEQGTKIKKTSKYLLIGMFMHNLPEGMAIATGFINGFSSTLAIAIAIAIHNIPEGICTSSAYYYSSKNRLKSFLLSSSTAIPIMIGFIIAQFIFKNIPLTIISMIIAATAGVMIYIAADELIPTSCNTNNKKWNHSTIFSLIFGVLFVMILI
ncbi:MAG: ZIP family metal transporter [DPANN group archaeon]|nr:ZIP family metal transporter [DPANN group archaeon]